MPSRRHSISMSETEISDFISTHNWAIVGTVGRIAPHLVTVGYCLVDSRVAFTAYTKSQKIVNLQRDSSISCLIESIGGSYAEIKGVLIQGRATVIGDPIRVYEIQDAAGRRVQDWPVELPRPLEEIASKRSAVIIEPVKMVSWDHQRLGGAY